MNPKTLNEERILPENAGKKITTKFIDSLFYRDKMPLFPVEYTAYKNNIIKAILDLRSISPETKLYIDDVLRSPHFKMEIFPKREFTGRYQGLEHSIVLSAANAFTKGLNSRSDTNTIKRNLLHEFWHAANAVRHSVNYYPLLPYNMTQPNLATPYYPPTIKKLEEMRQAISEDDMAILHTCFSGDENRQLILKPNTLHKYIQRRYIVLVEEYSIFNPVCMIDTVAYEHIPVYLDTFEGINENGMTALSGYSDKDPENKIFGLCYDALWRKTRLEHVYAHLRNTMFPQDNFIREVDAHIMEMTIPVVQQIYPKLWKLHEQDYYQNAKALSHYNVKFKQSDNGKTSSDTKKASPKLKNNRNSMIPAENDIHQDSRVEVIFSNYWMKGKYPLEKKFLSDTQDKNFSSSSLTTSSKKLLMASASVPVVVISWDAIAVGFLTAGVALAIFYLLAQYIIPSIRSMAKQMDNKNDNPQNYHPYLTFKR